MGNWDSLSAVLWAGSTLAWSAGCHLSPWGGKKEKAITVKSGLDMEKEFINIGLSSGIQHSLAGIFNNECEWIHPFYHKAFWVGFLQL